MESYTVTSFFGYFFEIWRKKPEKANLAQNNEIFCIRKGYLVDSIFHWNHFMKETPRRRIPLTSSLKKISTILMGNTSRVGVKGSITPVEGLYCKRPMSGIFRTIDFRGPGWDKGLVCARVHRFPEGARLGAAGVQEGEHQT